MQPVISLDHVTKRFGDFVAVDDVRFEIGRGEFFSLLGPSGCGKTTTLRMIAGFEEPSEGRVLLEGADVSRVPPYRRDVNTVFQHYALFPHLSVRDNVAFGPRSRRVPEPEVNRRVGELLEIVRLEGFGDRRPAQLSGGQQQRVALARALVNAPRALLLDEPLGALDLQLRQSMQSELKRIQREVGITFVYVTHDQEEALSMSDRIAVMNRGRIEQIAAPREIYEHPETLFVADFIGAANLLPVEVVSEDLSALTIRAGGRELALPVNGERWRAGEEATLVVRPERLRLSFEAPGIGPALTARVQATAFQGAVVRCTLLLDGGPELVAHVDASSDEAVIEPGARLWVGWNAGDGRLLRRAPDGAPRGDEGGRLAE